MEDTVGEQQQQQQQQPTVVVAGNSGKSKLRYPLRSSTKPKAEIKPPTAVTEPPNPSSSSSSASRRVRSAATVSKSVGVLDLPGKDKPAKPPRRLSIPAKSVPSPAQKVAGNITPISETRARRVTNGPGKSETPLSDVSRAGNRKVYNSLARASYWISRVKESECVSNHSISLGFFKLAPEAVCDPIQIMRLRDELKSYVRRHKLNEAGDAVIVKELFEKYSISENQEQVQVSETISQVPEEGTRSSDDEVRSSSSTIGARKLRPRSLNADAGAQAPTVTETSKKETAEKKTTSTRGRATLNKNTANSRAASDAESRKVQKKPQKTVKQEAVREKGKTIKRGKKSTSEEGSVSPADAAATPEENKENMDESPIGEISLTEVH